MKVVPFMILASASNSDAVTILVEARVDYVAEDNDLFALGDTIKVSIRFDENNMPDPRRVMHLREYFHHYESDGWFEIRLSTTSDDIIFGGGASLGYTPLQMVTISDEYPIDLEMTMAKWMTFQSYLYRFPGPEWDDSEIFVNFAYQGENAILHPMESPTTPLVFEDLYTAKVYLYRPFGYLAFSATIESYAMIPEPGSFGMLMVAGGAIAFRRKRGL